MPFGTKPVTEYTFPSLIVESGQRIGSPLSHKVKVIYPIFPIKPTGYALVRGP
jgi:hypothetical protein